MIDSKEFLVKEAKAANKSRVDVIAIMSETEKVKLASETIENFVSIFEIPGHIEPSEELKAALSRLETNPFLLCKSAEISSLFLNYLSQTLDMDCSEQLVIQTLSVLVSLINKCDNYGDEWYELDIPEKVQTIITYPNCEIQRLGSDLFLGLSSEENISDEKLEYLEANFLQIAMQWSIMHEDKETKNYCIWFIGNLFLSEAEFDYDTHIMLIALMADLIRTCNDKMFEKICSTANSHFLTYEMHDPTVYSDLNKSFWERINSEGFQQLGPDSAKLILLLIKRLSLPSDFLRRVNYLNVIKTINEVEDEKLIYVCMTILLELTCTHPDLINEMMENGMMEAFSSSFKGEYRTRLICLGTIKNIILNGDINTRICILTLPIMGDILDFINTSQDTLCNCMFITIVNGLALLTDSDLFPKIAEEYENEGWISIIQEITESGELDFGEYGTKALEIFGVDVEDD